VHFISLRGFPTMSETLQDIIDRLWMAPDDAEWSPKTDVVSLTDIRRWFSSTDVEIQGFAHDLIDGGRFRIEPSISVNEYKDFVMEYYERCILENPDGEWSDSRYSAGSTLVNIFAALWRDSSVSREILQELKAWLGRLYKANGAEIRTCLVTATLEHLFEQKDIRDFFSDWKNDPALAIAHKEASEWYLGGGNTPLGKPLFAPRKR
jgi:hypothetical protein